MCMTFINFVTTLVVQHLLIELTRSVHTKNKSYFSRVGPGRVAQSVTCLATDACLTADPGVASSIPARSHTFVEIDYGHSPPFR